MPTDNLKRWTAMAEIASAVAVVLSLIYVGYEIRRSTLESDADVQAELLSYSRDQRVLVVENGDLARVLTKGYADLAELTPEEALQFNNYVELHFVAWERAFMARESGVLSADNWAAWDEWFAATANRDPDFIWAKVRGTLRYKPFLQHADSALEFTEPRER
jgi:hypothetical protein